MLGPVLQRNFDLLADEVEAALRRLLADSPLGDAVPASGLARTISAGFIGIELLDTLRDGEGPDPFDSLDALSRLGDAILQAGPIEAGVIRRRLQAVRR